MRKRPSGQGIAVLSVSVDKRPVILRFHCVTMEMCGTFRPVNFVYVKMVKFNVTKPPVNLCFVNCMKLEYILMVNAVQSVWNNPSVTLMEIYIWMATLGTLTPALSVTVGRDTSHATRSPAQSVPRDRSPSFTLGSAAETVNHCSVVQLARYAVRTILTTAWSVNSLDFYYRGDRVSPAVRTTSMSPGTQSVQSAMTPVPAVQRALSITVSSVSPDCSGGTGSV